VPLAARIFTSFPNTFPPSDRVEVIGTPVRRSFAATDSPRQRLDERRAQRRRVLIVGGSQGARVLNKTVPAALARLPEALRPEVWHQAGRTTVDEARAAYASAGVDARVDTFIDDMPTAYRWADLVVARAGGSTLAELAIVGVGAILVPLANAIDDHQTANARHFTAGGAGMLLPESELDAATLARALQAVLRDVDKLIALAEAARAQARADAAERLATACLEAAEASR
jgi:UDP-N-acetylglucosamine--N-acetylmuramyl-(pentapeptide) pyrophosphoryl-undecaprenol N-acetylglucosamine transferase